MAGFNPRRYREIATGQEVVADSPDVAAGVEASGEYDRLLPEARYFINLSNDDAVRVDTPDVFSGISQDTGFRPATAEESEKARAKVRAQERARIQAEGIKDIVKQHGFLGPVTAFGAGLATTGLPFGLGESIMERAGLSKEAQEALSRAAPTSSTIGKATGVASTLASVLATGGASAAGIGAGRAAAGVAAATGAGRAAQVAAAARAALTVPVQLAEKVSPFVAAGGRLGAATEAAISAAAPSLQTGVLGGLIRGAAAGAVGAGGAATLTEATEAAIEHRKMSSEAILSQMKIGSLIGGAAGGVLGVPDTLKPTSGMGQFLQRNRAQRIYRAHAPEYIAKAQKQIGMKQPENLIELINEAADKGIIAQQDDALTAFSRVAAAREEAGDFIGKVSQEADATLGKPMDVSDLWDNVADKVIAPLSKSGTVESEQAARKIQDQLERFKNVVGNEMTLSDLANLRTEIGGVVYGPTPLAMRDPSATMYSDAMRDVMGVITDKIGEGVVQAGMKPQTWKAFQRNYQVIKHAEGVAMRSISKYAGSSKDDRLLKITNPSDLIAIATGLSQGLGAGAMTKAALSLAGSAVPRVADWTTTAMRRAAVARIPPVMGRALEDIQAEKAQLAETQLMSLAMRPEANAQEEFLKAHDDVLQLLEQMRARPKAFPAKYVEATEEAAGSMQSIYDGLSATGSTASAPTVEQMGDALESARNIFRRMSAPTTAGGPAELTKSSTQAQQQAVEAMRGLRDQFTGLLAEPTGIWGAARLEKAADEARALQAAFEDPARVVRLKQLEDAALQVRSGIADRSGKLMRQGAAIAAPRVATKLSDYYDRVMEHAEEETHP
jgi:uncharacterized protein YfcZ (UPF0381/DUF406 family)